MRISIVIPTYARQDATVRAIRSALEQDAPFEEVFVVDDDSPAPFVLPADLAADPRVRLERLPQNQGESGARNHGVTNARGDWIAYLDSDDYWLPGKLREQVAFIAQDQALNPDPLVLYACGFRQLNLNTGATTERIPIASSNAIDFASGAWLAQGSTGMFPKSLFDHVGPYDTRLRRLMDLDWLLRMGVAGGKAKVAPVIGAVVEVGTRPSPQSLDVACRILEEKFLSPGPERLPPVMQKHLQAYLDVERAAASRYASRYHHMLAYLARSLWRVPRTQVPLRRWWTAP